MSENRKADAVLVPESMKSGSRSYHRISSILDVAEPLMGITPGGGEKGYVQRVAGFQTPDGSSYLLCTPHAPGTLLHPKSHPKSGHPRFRWEPLDGGPIRLGYLIEDPENGCPA